MSRAQRGAKYRAAEPGPIAVCARNGSRLCDAPLRLRYALHRVRDTRLEPDVAIALTLDRTLSKVFQNGLRSNSPASAGYRMCVIVPLIFCVPIYAAMSRASLRLSVMFGITGCGSSRKKASRSTLKSGLLRDRGERAGAVGRAGLAFRNHMASRAPALRQHGAVLRVRAFDLAFGLLRYGRERQKQQHGGQQACHETFHGDP